MSSHESDDQDQGMSYYDLKRENRRLRGFLDEVIAESTARNPDFPSLLAKAEAMRDA